MEKNIYLEVSEAIENYSDYKDYEIFNVLHEMIYVFDKYVIEGDLKEKINKVLHDFYKLSSFNIEKPLFNDQSNIDFISQFSDYLEYRYNNADLFFQGPRYIDSTDYESVKKISVKDLTPLDNRFFDSQAFYLYGMLDPALCYELQKDKLIENQFRFYGNDGGKMILLLSNIPKTELITLHQLDGRMESIIYGKVSFDINLMENIVNSKNFYRV